MENHPKPQRTTTNPIPRRIAEELDMIESALRDPGTEIVQWGQLYVAQQALTWAVNEDLAASPYGVIVEGKVQPPIADTPAG